VADEGLGLPQTELGRLFERFYRVNQPDRRHIGGSGLGLAVCRELIEAQDGNIWAESPGLGHGATFKFTLPAAEAGHARPVPAGPSRTSGGSDPAQPVLVVKDDPSYATYVATLLREDGYRIRHVSTGEEAIVVAERERPRAILLDIELGGGLDGWEVLSTLRQRPATATVPILVTTSRTERARGLALGADEYLVKPVSGARLLAVVRRLAGPPSVHILAVDDDPSMRELVHSTLTGAGYRVSLAADGFAALDCLVTSPPDLVLLDLLIPGPDGFAVLERIRAADQSRNVPVLVLTGKSLTVDDKQRLTAGVAAILQKDGVGAADLVEAIRHTLSTSKGIPLGPLTSDLWRSHAHHPDRG
jgi:DNA-binding response OmpR family regulator